MQLVNLRKYRKAKGLKQKELADLVGVSESLISQFESGKKHPSFETALKIAEVLGCETYDLISNKEENPATYSDGTEGISEKDRKFIVWFRSLSPEKQQAILISQDAPKDIF